MIRLPLVLLVLFVASSVQGAIQVGVSGPGTLNSTIESDVFFPQNNFTGPGTITDWSISGFAPVIKTVEYATADLDFTGAFNSGFRWAETLTNTSTSAWANFVISLIDTSDTASGLGNFLFTPIGTAEVPGFATITGTTIVLLSDVGTPLPVSGWVLDLSGDLRTITMSFPTPVLPGQSVQVHIPIVNVGAGDGTFVLSQQAVATPEPTTFVVWSLLLSVGAALGLRSRN